jgi:hypothetical protein
MQEDDLHAKPVIGEFRFVRLGMMFSLEKLGHGQSMSKCRTFSTLIGLSPSESWLDWPLTLFSAWQGVAKTYGSGSLNCLQTALLLLLYGCSSFHGLGSPTARSRYATTLALQDINAHFFCSCWGNKMNAVQSRTSCTSATFSSSLQRVRSLNGTKFVFIS